METNSRFTLKVRLIFSFIAAVVLSVSSGFSAEQSLSEIESANVIEMQKHYDNLELDLNTFDQIPRSLFSVESIDLLTLRSRSSYLEQMEKPSANEVTDGVVTVGYGTKIKRQLPLQLADIKIKKIVIIGTIRDNTLAPISSNEIYEWFAEHMPNCEVEVRQGN